MKCSIEDKMQAKQWEKVIYKVYAEKELVSRISEEFSKFDIKTQKLWLENWQKTFHRWGHPWST